MDLIIICRERKREFENTNRWIRDGNLEYEKILITNSWKV